MMEHLNWTLKSWDELSLEEFYAFSAQRIAVFVVEQDCPYQDFDGKDDVSHHLWASNSNGEVAAYLRIVKPGVSYKEVSIGRVLTAHSARRTGVGLALMEKGVAAVMQLYGAVDIKISAQEYLINYYEKFGFKAVGEGYLEDDIPHIAMIRKAKA